MIIVSLLLMQAAYSLETEAVMNRARETASERRAVHAPVNDMARYLPDKVAERLQRCIDIAIEDPDNGAEDALIWAGEGGGFSAGQCLGFAYARAERWNDASVALEAAAELANRAAAQADAARLWAQAGNAALAGGDASRAKSLLDKALSGSLAGGLALGEAHLDRARALVVLDDMQGARADLDRAVELASEDPLAWLLSATLARRMTDLSRAAHDIAEAKLRAPDDASIALEAGKIAILSGDDARAKEEWARVLTLAPSSEQAVAAREMLGRLDQDEP